MDAAPLEWVRYVANWITVPYDRRSTPKQLRQEVSTWVQDKDTRMSPWGMQAYHPTKALWIPPTPYQGHAVICGRWIRDIEFPSHHASHPLECDCAGRPPPKLTFSDTPEQNSGVLRAFQRDEVTDPRMDLAESLPPSGVTARASTRCLLTALPQELLDMILDHLVPIGNVYQFLPARHGTQTLQLVQKLVPEPETRNLPETILRSWPCSGDNLPNSVRSLQESRHENPATGSTHISLAGTSKHFQDLIYSRFYGQNGFVFHLTPATIHSSVSSSDFKKFRCWSRTTKQEPAALGPITGSAARYMKDVTLIASLPFVHGSPEINALSRLLQDAASALSAAKLDYLGVALNLAKPGTGDRRFAVKALSVDLLTADVDNENRVRLRIREPTVESVRESNKTQQALSALLQGPKGVEEVVLCGPMSEGFVRQLDEALKSQPAAEAIQDTSETSTETDGRQNKRQRVR